MPSAPTRVLFISGLGRSGSTIIGQILGSTPGFAHVGELNFLWRHNLLENRHCSCGQPFDACPFWREAMGRAFGGLDAVDPREMIRLEREGMRTRHGLQLLLPYTRRRVVARMHPVIDRMARLYATVRELSGAEVIVDSSKLPSYGYLQSTSELVDLRAVHLVRDPRAAAYSWLHRSGRGEAGHTYMPKIGTGESSLTWSVWNVVTEALWRESRGRYLQVRYEDFVERPEAVMQRIVSFAGLDGAPLPFTAPRTVSINAGHTVAGNPNRFDTGSVEIEADEEWRDKMSRRQYAAVTALTFPMLPRYHYPFRGRATQNGAGS